jgi:hypothetical protein
LGPDAGPIPTGRIILDDHYEYDSFVSHASEGKNVAEPLVEKLVESVHGPGTTESN